MHVALVALEMEPRAARNRASMVTWLAKAADEGADLVVFPEGAPTGLVNDDHPDHDRPLGETVPGPTTDLLGCEARRLGVHVALGLIERDGDVLYDTAVLLDARGRLVHRHRRTHPGWHGPRADPAVYREGTETQRVETALGSFAFLVCGELFDDRAVARVRELGADVVLLLLWRCFDDGSTDQARWEDEELPDYTARVARLETRVLAVNGLAPRAMEGGSFGGAWVWDRDGALRASLALGTAGMLNVAS